MFNRMKDETKEYAVKSKYIDLNSIDYSCSFKISVNLYPLSASLLSVITGAVFMRYLDQYVSLHLIQLFA